jgi:hypothetical protein
MRARPPGQRPGVRVTSRVRSSDVMSSADQLISGGIDFSKVQSIQIEILSESRQAVSPRSWLMVIMTFP